MADNIIKNINLSDGTKADLKAKYWGDYEPSEIAKILENNVKFATINEKPIFGGENITLDNITIDDVEIKKTSENEIIVSVNGTDSTPFTVPFATKSFYTEYVEAPKLNVDDANKIYISVGEDDNQIKSDSIIVPYATTAKNLLDDPKINSINNDFINITVGGRTSNDFKVHYSENASYAEYVGSLIDKPVFESKKVNQNIEEYKSINITVGGQTTEDFIVPYAEYARNLITMPKIYSNNDDKGIIIEIGDNKNVSEPFTVPYATESGSAKEYSGSLSLNYDRTNSELTVSLGKNTSIPVTLPTNNGSGTATISTVTIDSDPDPTKQNEIIVYVNGTKSNNFIVPYATTAGSATTADSANYATTAGTATTAGSATTADSANYATTAESANYATEAGSANEYTGSLSLNYDRTNSELTVSLGKNTSIPVTLPTNSESSTIEISEDDTSDSNLPILFKGSEGSINYNNGFNFNPSQKYIYASGFFETSDGSLKDIVNPIDVDLDKLSKLRKVYFTWQDNQDSDLQIGMIAQDVKELYPELVSENNGKLSLAYDRLSVVALEAIDVLHRENNELKTRIEKLESLVNQLVKNN